VLFVGYLNIFDVFFSYFEIDIKVGIILPFHEDFNGIAEWVEPVVASIFVIGIDGTIHDSNNRGFGQNRYDIVFQIFFDPIVEGIFELVVVVGIVLSIHLSLEISNFNLQVVTKNLLDLLGTSLNFMIHLYWILMFLFFLLLTQHYFKFLSCFFKHLIKLPSDLINSSFES
jgi:hypothetical protein